MNFSVTELFLIFTAYLLFLFVIAYATERNIIPRRIAEHPLVQAVALGTYASIWTFYGAFGMIEQSGMLFLSSYLGATAAFFLAPILFTPIFNITNRYKLSSLADLFAFRFRSAMVGTVTTLLLFAASLPLISIQIQAVSSSLNVLNRNVSSPQIAAAYCTLIALFAILFGTRHPSLRARNRGLIMAMATSSVIKLMVLMGIALYILFTVFQGPLDLHNWLMERPMILERLLRHDEGENWRTLLLTFFTAALVMPHMFHLAFTENRSADTLRKASWGMPLYLMGLAVTVPIIVWGGYKLQVTDHSSFVLLFISKALESDLMTIAVLIGGLTAASGIIIVTAISMASMMQNHVILPLIKTPGNIKFYDWLLWLRRILIIAVVACSYLFYSVLGGGQQLHLLGLSAFIAFLQFLPGVLATLFWLGANRIGFIAGITIGMLSWSITTFYPFFQAQTSIRAIAESVSINEINWQSAAIVSLILNIVVFVLVSRFTKTTQEERRAAEACFANTMDSPTDIARPAFETKDIIRLLTPKLGEVVARRELQLAIRKLNLTNERIGPLDMLRLKNTLEQNLSALIGPIESATLLEPLSKVPEGSAPYPGRDIHLLESHLETYQAKLSGLAAELDEVRRYHRTTLEKLPIGACTVTPNQRIVFWNHEMARLTSLNAREVGDLTLSDLPAPWSEVLPNFIQQSANHLTEIQVRTKSGDLYLTLHKSAVSDKPDSAIVLLVEDETNHHLLTEKLTHNERLASIGRFAAGVAHEIGNPVTGIACLAQNLSLETDQPEVLDTGDQIVEQTKRISRIVQSLIRFARTGQSMADVQLERLSLTECLDEAIHLVTLDSHAKQHDFFRNVPEGLELEADPQLLLQVLVNLLNNACDASPADGAIWIEAHSLDGQVQITITDEGCGIDPAIQDKLFEPFFTTKDPGKGTGLGLALVYNIISEHYGSIELISPANAEHSKGTQVVITLPGLQEAAENRPEPDEQ
jgi:signal transduction histidine kinase/Na+/proline symporter